MGVSMHFGQGENDTRRTGRFWKIWRQLFVCAL